jgi:hypothetical protein
MPASAQVGTAARIGFGSSVKMESHAPAMSLEAAVRAPGSPLA